MASSQPWFANASNFEVKDSQFTNVTINNNDPVSTTLWPHVAAGAIFNSAVRYAAGKCHPGTRRKIIDRIVDWINDPDPTKSILWIYGPAGAGKSAIAQTICELLKESHPNHDGGSFFFTSGPTECGNALKLFTTLSYQLAIHFPSIRAEINNALSRDPSLPTKSMGIQLLSLIIQPLLQCQTLLSHIPVLIIDGLDECANDNGTTQGDIVALISKCLVEHNVPIRFMILSRPEYWIRDAFETAPLPNITLSLSLRDNIDADKDVRAYLTAEFERIRMENKRFMKSVVLPWPSEWIIDDLVYEASGQFIYAATVLKFVGKFSKFSNPQKQLEIITSRGPHRALAFSELDRLYATILSAYPHWETMKRVLAALLLYANTTIITVCLGVDSDELTLVLDALSSLIEIQKLGPLSDGQILFESICGSLQDPTDIISFCHRSFREFLHDKSRSGAFYIDLASDTVPKKIVDGYFDLVYQNMKQNYIAEPHIFSNVDLATYSYKMPRVTRRSIRYCSMEMLMTLLTDMTAKLTTFSPSRLAHVHSVFYFIHSMDLFRDEVLRVFPDDILDGVDFNEDPGLLELQSAWKGLEEAINLACRTARSALNTCTDFQATPTFVYLTEYWFSETKSPLDGLSAIVGVTDAISSLKQHRYIFLYRYYHRDSDRWNPPGKAFRLFPDNTKPNWRNHGAWRDLRISFVPKVLRSILEAFPNADDMFDGDDTRDIAVTRFFDSRSISHIGDNEYFQNASNLAILAVMTDLAAWVQVAKIDCDSLHRLERFLVSMVSWFNRQLTNPQTVSLLENYDTTLPQKMTRSMKYIFEHGFLRGFKTYRTSNYIQDRDGTTLCTVWPLSEGAYKEKNTLFVDWHPPYRDNWQTFHDEVFGNVEQNITPIIDRSEWHPHLVTRLLITLVQFFHRKIHARCYPLHVGSYGYNYEKSLSYLTQCIPYGHPTPENLDALRLIVYLYPQVTPAWNPPEGLWASLAELIQKYDSSMLSSEEKQLFLLWLNSEEHADIKTYIGMSSRK